MAIERRPNRRGLSDDEIAQLDHAVAVYEEARREAYMAYMAALSIAVRARDRVILDVIDAGPRSTQARVAEHLGMRPATLTAIRKRTAERHTLAAA